MENHDFLTAAGLLRQKPHALARLVGGSDAPLLRGMVRLYPMPRGILLAVEADGLPQGTFFRLYIEGEIPLPSLVAVRGRTLQVMLVGSCTVEDMIGREVTISHGDPQQILARGTISP